MKRIRMFLIAALLAGCSIREASLPKKIDDVIETMSTMKATVEANHRREYLDYYLPRHIGRRYAQKDNAIFVRDNHEFYMYLDVSSIIIDEYYKTRQNSVAEAEEVTVGKQIYHKKGTMKNFYSAEKAYDLTIEAVGDEYLIFLKYGVLRFTALLPLSEVEQTIYDMFLIARSTRVDRQAVLADYSNKSVVVITNKYDLFETVFPESGVIADVLNLNPGGNVHEEATQTPGSQNSSDGIVHEEPTGESVGSE